MSMESELYGLLVPHSERINTINDRKELWAHQQRWRASFWGNPVEWKHGNSLEWEAIASGAIPSLRGGRASSEFAERLRIPTLFELVITERLGQSTLFILHKPKPSLYRGIVSAWNEDLYVTEGNFEWCLIRTHEEPHIGPFFLSAQMPQTDGI